MTGTIPTEIGLIKTLKRFSVSQNQLVGKIPSGFAESVKMEELNVDNNQLTGTLPDIFSNLNKLKQLYVNNNELNGAIPSSIWNVSSLKSLRLIDNQLSGTVPDTYCKSMLELHVDNSLYFMNAPKVTCSCCERSCRLWDPIWNPSAGAEICPEENILNLRNDFEISPTNVTDIHSNETTDPNDGICSAPTGCYLVQGLDLTDRLKPKEWFFGYSRKENSIVMSDPSDPVCDAIEICGMKIHSNDPRRSFVDYVGQIGLNAKNLIHDTESDQHHVFCQMIDGGKSDSPINHLNECDGTLLQFYVINLLFRSTKYQDFNDSFVSTDDLCSLNQIECDDDQKFIEEINLHDQKLEGTLIREIGLLQSLKKLDLSENQLKGTINGAILKNNLPNLEIINLANNSFEGTISELLMSHPTLRELKLSNNNFVGTLPPNFSCPSNLSKYL